MTMTKHYSLILRVARTVYLPPFFLSNLAFIIQEQASPVAQQVDSARAAAVLHNFSSRGLLKAYEKFHVIPSERFSLDLNQICASLAALQRHSQGQPSLSQTSHRPVLTSGLTSRRLCLFIACFGHKSALKGALQI